MAMPYVKKSSECHSRMLLSGGHSAKSGNPHKSKMDSC